MRNFHPPPPLLFLNHADAQTSNTSTRLWFYYIITKIHPPFQNPGSAPAGVSTKCPLVVAVGLIATHGNRSGPLGRPGALETTRCKVERHFPIKLDQPRRMALIVFNSFPEFPTEIYCREVSEVGLFKIERQISVRDRSK